MDPNISNTPLNTKVVNPTFDRSALKSRIVHIGFGAFHRAHQALYTNQLLETSESDWGICEISLFGTGLISQLREQDHLYSVLEKGSDNTAAKICGAVTESVHPKLDGIQAVLDKMAEPQVAIVSLTITEKGYCADLNTGELDRNNSLIRADLANPSEPQSAIGFIVEALRLRKQAGSPAFTVMSCDNVPDNSQIAKQVILDYAKALDTSLASWIEENVTFPCTMVDRIVPAMSDESFDELEAQLGVADPCGVISESFSQWVIEDNFVNGRPDWDKAGATFVDDVRPFEDMKLRLLNGSHSFLAYLGYLAGYRYIYETMADDAFREATLKLMLDEQAITLSMPEGTSLEDYANQLITRFSNTNIKHETYQIATDGSQKLPQRFCESLRFNLDNNTPTPWLILGLAGWMVYVDELDESGQTITVNDPMLDQIRKAYSMAKTPEQIVKALLDLSMIFGNDLIANKTLMAGLTEAVTQLKASGAKALVANTLHAQTT
ncbi:fructuronate reductase [Leucothrix sargassi]|nr:fructuronate reductase [Leucothrix sargassi]